MSMAGFICGTYKFRVQGSKFRVGFEPGLNISSLEPFIWDDTHMKIERFEDIKAWQLAREMTRGIYRMTKRAGFRSDFELKGQIQGAAGSAMHNIAEGFDSESNAEFVRFLRYAKRSCTEVQSELYVALDEEYIDQVEFNVVYDQAARTRAAIHGFIRYLETFEKRRTNLEL